MDIYCLKCETDVTDLYSVTKHALRAHQAQSPEAVVACYQGIKKPYLRFIREIYFQLCKK